MGKKKSFINDIGGSTVSKAFGKDSFITKAVSLAGKQFASPVALIPDAVRNVGEGLGEVTGSNALRKQAMDQQQAAEELAKRQADQSDAMARDAGGDATNIFLASGKRKRGGSGSTGSSGTSNSRDTGVQS